MKAALRFFGKAMLAIAVIAAPGVLLPTAASAAAGDFCMLPGDKPGILIAAPAVPVDPLDPDGPTMPGGPDTCEPDTNFLQGMECGIDSGSFYNSTQKMCIANATSCEISGVSGEYLGGQCRINITPPTTPDIGDGLTIDPNAGLAPTGEMQPMCVNASPFIGGGMFVVTGAVLCYEGAGRPTGIQAYTDNGTSGGWNPFDRDTWDSLYVMNDLFAGDDITAVGTMSAFGGAQFFSPNGLNGIQVNDSGALIHSQDTNGNVASITTTPGNIHASATNGTAASSLQISGNGTITSAATNGTGGQATHHVNGDGTISSVVVDGTGNGAAHVVSGTGNILSTAGNGTASASHQVDGQGIVATAASDGSAQAGVTVNGQGTVTTTATDGTTGAEHIVDAQGNVTSTATDGTGIASVAVNGDGTVFVTANDGSNSSIIGVSGTDGVGIVGHSETIGAGVAIGGKVGATSTVGVGTAITGSGQGGLAAPTSGPASWADVAIGSNAFAPGNGQGAGIIVNDSGVTVVSAATGNSFNSFGSAEETVAGANVINQIGTGGAGNVFNIIGAAGQSGSTVVNAIGVGNTGGATTNMVGNTHAQTTFGVQAGTSSIVAIQGALDFATGQGASILTAPTQLVAGGSSTTMLGTSGHHLVADANGKLTMINGVAAQASSALYIVNGHGTTNGVMVTEQSASLSGGTTNPTTLALSDTGAHFSNAMTGAPVRVSGVADGVGPFDGANIRQLHSGIASVAALSGLPAPQEGKRNSFGIAMGAHGSGTALALGGQALLGEGFSIKYGAALGYAGGLVESTASVGIGMSW